MKEYYKLLGLAETATDEQIREAYYRLKGKYMEERWQDGEAGNEAARMLNKLETAYNEIRLSREQKAQNTEGKSAFEKVSACLKSGDLSEAQRLLDEFNERSAEWHYLQAVVFYKKNWENESRKQLEIAMQMDPANVKYREEYNKLKAKNNYANAGNPYAKQGENRQNPYSNNPQGQGQDYGSYEDPQMGGNACSDCISCCYTYLCVDCLFSLCCGCR